MDQYLKKAAYAAAFAISIVEVIHPNSIIPGRYDFAAAFILNVFGSGTRMISVITLTGAVIIFLNVVTVAYCAFSKKKSLRDLEVNDGTKAAKTYIWLLHKTVWTVFYWIVSFCGYALSLILSPPTTTVSSSSHGAVYGILAANSLVYILNWTPKLSEKKVEKEATPDDPLQQKMTHY